MAVSDRSAPFLYTLNASTIRPVPILDQIRIAAQAGYAAIELWHDAIDAHLERGGTLDEIRRALDAGRLQVPTTIYLKGWFETTGAEHERELAECVRRMKQAAALGAVHVIAGPPAGKADLDLGARNYRELLALGREIGVKPAMEFLGFVEDLNTVTKALAVVQRSGDPDGTIVLDPFHIFRGGGNIDEIGQLAAHQVAICHFNDIPPAPPREQQHDHDRVYPGDGVFDLRGMLRRLQAIGYGGWLSLELFREDLWRADPLEVAREGLRKMQQVVERL